MQKRVLSTPVDSLVETVKKHKTVKVKDLPKMINVPMPLIERWLIILEEYNVVNVSYRNLEGFVHFNENKEGKKVEIEEIKNEFIARCREKNLTIEQIKTLWFKFLHANKSEIKAQFFKESKQKGYNKTKTELAWKKFEKTLEGF